MTATITIPRRCNGPPDSANGGYASGLVAAELGGGTVEVSLRAPPPLERPLGVRREDGAVRILDGETLIADARHADPGVEPPIVPGLDAARRASELGRERWASRHPFPTCVTCGPDRAPGDGLRIFPGELPGGGAFASVWTPDTGLGVAGIVADPWVWAALDCPSSAPVIAAERRAPWVLARLCARLDAPVMAGRPYAIVSWSIAAEGRKHHSASALLDPGGELVAVARALWIELRER